MSVRKFVNNKCNQCNDNDVFHEMVPFQQVASLPPNSLITRHLGEVASPHPSA